MLPADVPAPFAISRPRWLDDTIARRFAVTALLAVACALALIFLFQSIGGIWSQEPLEETGLLQEAQAILRLIEAAPAGLRPMLCRAVTTPEVHAQWLSEDSSAAAALVSFKGQKSADGRAFARQMARATVVFSPRHPDHIPRELSPANPNDGVPYILAIELQDRSWLAFAVPTRSWGLSRPVQWTIRFLFLVVSIALVTAIAAKQFSKPIEELAAAVCEFGKNPQATSIAERGPRELRQFIRTFNDMRSQIQTFVSHRTTMLAAISHDLRTPLTRIRLRGELIEDPDQQGRLFRDVDEMQSMVDGALAFFRDDAVAEDDTTLDLPLLITMITNDYADLNILIPYSGPTSGIIHGRPLALRRALTNLIDNAVKYGGNADIMLKAGDRFWSIAVRDSGPGIPADALHTVFRPYHRLDKSRNRATGGVGLGLTVAQTIIQAHGGNIVLANRQEGGLVAEITLPSDPALDRVAEGVA